MSRIALAREQLRSPLARRLIVAIILFSSAITLVLTSFQLYGEYRGQLTEIEGAFQQVENAHLETLTRSLWTASVENIRLQLEGIERLPNLEYVAVREGGKLWAEAGRRISRYVLERQYPMRFKHLGRVHELGTLTAVAGLDAVYRELIVRAFVILANNALKTFLVAGFSLFFFHRLVNRHLADIARYLHGLDPGKHGAPLRLARPAAARPDDLEEVVAAINFLQERAYSALEALRQSNAGYRILIQSAPDGIFSVDAQGRFLDVNQQCCEMLGYAREEILALSIGEIVVPEERVRVATEIARLHAGEVTRCECNIRRKDETRFPVEMNAAILPKGRILIIARDMTERRRALDEISRQRDQLAAMTRRMAALQEKQRRDMARELHDRVGQNLTSLAINLARLRGDAKGRESAARIADCHALVEATGLIVQDVLTELKPPMLANYGLEDALRWHAREFSRRTGIAAEVIAAGPQRRTDVEIELALFRVAQASLNNVVQHARAKNVRLTVEAHNGKVRLEIRDNGIGFDVAQAFASGRWGLAAMRERAEAVDGEMRVDSAPGRGTRIVVEAPLRG